MNYVVTTYKRRVQLHASVDFFHLENILPVKEIKSCPCSRHEGVWGKEVLDEGKMPGPLHRQESARGAYWTGDREGLRGGLDLLDKGKVSVVQPVIQSL
jgi:hypothetical protein